jgi:AraC-like DNA-binding protein
MAENVLNMDILDINPTPVRLLEMSDQDAPYFSRQVIRANRFYQRLPPKRDYRDTKDEDRIHVVAAGFERCGPGYSIRRGDFPYLALEFVADGEGRLELGHREWDLSRGTLFTYGPAVSHSIFRIDSKGLGKYFFNITGEEAAVILEYSSLPPGSLMQVAAPGELEPLFNELIRNGQKGTAFSGRICVSLVRLILLKVQENALPFPGRNSRAYHTFSRCRRIMEEQFLTLGSLEEAAGQCHVDPAYLCRLFKDYAHQSPYKYLVRLKLNRAAEILHDPSILVREAAREVGFSDPFHFSRLFARSFGISPARYSSLYGRLDDSTEKVPGDTFLDR